MRDRLLRMLSLGIRQFKDPYYQGFAAQLSFYFILSIVPIVILISQILGHFFETNINEAMGWLLTYIKGDLAETIKDMLSYRSAGAVNAAYVFIALWSASRAQFSMLRLTNFTYTKGESMGQGYWRDRLRAMLTMGITIIVIIVSLVVLLYGGKILERITTVGEIWIILRWPIAFALYFVMIGFNFYMIPSKRVKIKEVIPGTIFASLGLLLVTLVYSVYIDRVANYDLLYSSLANVVALLFWFYFLAWVIGLGVIVNRVWMDTDTKGYYREIT